MKNLLKLKVAFMAFMTTLLLAGISQVAQAQSMGIGATTFTPLASSILEIRSTTLGLLIPRMTTTERDAIGSTATGLLIYNTTTNAFNYYNGGWIALGTGNGTVTSVTGTTNRITSTGGATPAIDISGSYVGQTTITTLGTIGTGTWNATTIGVGKGGTGITNTPANGALLIGNGTNYTSATLTAGNGTAITNGAGSISIGNTPTLSSTGTSTLTSTTSPVAFATFTAPAAGDYLVQYSAEIIGNNKNAAVAITDIAFNGSAISGTTLSSDIASGSINISVSGIAIVTANGTNDITVRFYHTGNAVTLTNRWSIIKKVN